MTVTITTFAYQSWMIAPAAPIFNVAPPKTFRDQRWTMTLSGIAMPNFVTFSPESQWSSETFSFSPDVTGPIERALSLSEILAPEDLDAVFVVDDYATFVTINSIFNKNDSANSGFAVDNCVPNFGFIEEAPDKATVNNVLGPASGETPNGEFLIDLGVRGSDAVIYRVGYNIALYGRIAFGEAPVLGGTNR